MGAASCPQIHRTPNIASLALAPFFALIKNGDRPGLPGRRFEPEIRTSRGDVINLRKRWETWSTTAGF